MRGSGKFQTALLTGAILAGTFLTASPAFAGRCGAHYPVDAPITMREVASRCNVSLAALREANPGVDPDNVRPGQHLSLPDEITEFSKYVKAPSAPPSTPSTYVHTGSRDNSAAYIPDDEGMGQIYTAQDVRGDGRRPNYRIRVRDLRVAPRGPSWLTDDPVGGHYTTRDSTLSYQKLSAQRIRTASVQSINFSTLNAVPLYSDGTEGVPHARFTSNSQLTTSLPQYVEPSLKTKKDAAKIEQASFSLSGEIVDTYQGCLILRAEDDSMWRLAAAPPIGELIGKKVMVWGDHATSQACDGGPAMLVNHAVFVEPWIGGE
jgi:hypothetical protein